MTSSDGTINATKCLFGDLLIGDKFVFEYEYSLFKDKEEKGFYPERWQQYLSILTKETEDSYSNKMGEILFDNRKYFSRPKIKGYSYSNTAVYKL